MKYPYYSILICLCALISKQLWAQEISPFPELDSQNGFFEIELGSHFTKYKNLKPQGQFQHKDRYQKTDITQYNNIVIKTVYLQFYKQELHSLIIKTESEKNSHAFLELLKLFYGDGSQDGMAPFYIWKGNIVTLKYDENLFTKNADIVFESVEIQKKFEKEWREVRNE